MILRLAEPVTTRWERHGTCNGCGHCCQFLGERVMTMTFTGQSDEYDRRYLELRGIQIDTATRTGTKKIGIFLPCTAHDNAAKQCTVYETRPRTCRDFPWGPEQIAGTPCSFWFTRQVNGREETIGGDGAPALLTREGNGIHGETD